MVETVNKPDRRKITLSLVLGLSMALVTYNLGQWQTRRAEEKQGMVEKIAQAIKSAPLSPETADLDPVALEYRQVELEGRYLPETTVYIDNRQLAGRPAVQVIQGFQPEGRDFVIPVDRGLLPRDPREPRRAPDLPASSATEMRGTGEVGGAAEASSLVRLKGSLLTHFPRSAELRGLGFAQAGEILKDEQNGYRVWSNFELKDFAELTGLKVSAYVLTVQPVQESEASALPAEKVNGFYLNAVKIPEMVAKHRGYAFQWFSMTAVLVLLTGLLVYREMRNRP